ncbi:MAG: hypothetical protein WC791_03445 [Candidatus Paceibacterota bacterium]|jgi:hypothetical protein
MAKNPDRIDVESIYREYDARREASKVPMTKARAGEILYESLKKALMHDGLISEKDHADILEDLREDLSTVGISDGEIVALAELLRNDVNKTLQTH